MMLGIIAREIRTWLFPVLIVTLWCHPAIAVEILPEDAGRGEVVSLYNNLGQNIAEESNLYSEYSDYRENLRLKVFWEELEGLNRVRDEIILSIRFLESSLEGKVSESVYATVGSFPITSGPEYLSEVFSNWRPFYFLISGGFFLIFSCLVVMAICTTCRRNAMSFMMNRLEQSISDDIDGMTKFRKAA